MSDLFRALRLGKPRSPNAPNAPSSPHAQETRSLDVHMASADAPAGHPSVRQDRKDRGRAGEDAAEALLRRAGFRILHRNWRKGSSELDLVTMDGDTLVFVEVRTRRAGGMTSPMESLHPAKCRHVVQAAKSYLAANNLWHLPCRFDFVCVVDTGTTLELEHLRHVDLSEYLAETVGRGNATWQPW